MRLATVMESRSFVVGANGTFGGFAFKYYASIHTGGIELLTAFHPKRSSTHNPRRPSRRRKKEDKYVSNTTSQ